MIRVTNVTKEFDGPDGPVRALSGVELEIRAGELVVLVGPSGSGKSTLLFCMGGLLSPDGGEVRIDGVSLYGLPSAQRARARREQLGFVFQTFNLVPYLTCLENVALPLRLSGAPAAEAEAQARPLLERLGLAQRRAHRPDQLSVGERQRVAIARATVHRPRVVLADEPTGNLDPASATGVLDLLRELNAGGQTIVVVTHDPRVAAAGGRVLSLEAGRLGAARAGIAA